MKRNIFTHSAVFFLIFFSFCFSFQKAEASHAMGADLWYECINPSTNTYVISLRFYRDCYGIDVPSTETVTLASASCGQSISLTLEQLPCPPNPNGGIACEVSPLCPAFINQSQCSNINNPYPGVQAYTYTDTFVIPMACSDWIFSFDECCRNAAITNLNSPDSYDLYVEAHLNNVIASFNSSPVFTTLPVPFICANQPFSYNHGAIDADGDSLVYSMVNPLSLGNAIPYAGTFNPTQPVFTAPPTSLTFGSSTGQMSFTPNGIQVAVITVLVEEYRNGVLIGSTMRDIQVVVLNIAGCGVPPIFTGAIQPTVVNGYYINSGVVEVCPGSALSFDVLAYDPTGDSVFTISDVAVSIPGATVSYSYADRDSLFAHITWTPSALDTGINNLVFTVSNHNCPISSVQAFAVTINVLAGTYAGPDLKYCPAGGPVQLQAYGGTAFTWSPSTGLNNPNISNPQASPSQTTTYIVTSNLSSNCNNIDTITVFRVPDFVYTATQGKDTICRFEFVDLNVFTDSLHGPYTYTWTPASSLNAGNIPNPTAQPNYTTTYTITITSDSGCIIKDTSLTVVVSGQGPLVQISADKNKVCPGDTIHLTTTISNTPCGLNVVPCQGNSFIKDIGNGTVQDFNGATPYRGLYMDARMQILYRAAELQAMGMTAGTITDIAFDISQAGSTQPYNGFSIKMGCTNETDLSNKFVTGLSTVVNPFAFSQSGTGYNTHTFDNPYDWDGLSNLVIEVCFDNQSWTNDDDVNATATSYNSVSFAYQDNSVGCNLPFSFNSVNRPNTRFIYCTNPPANITYSWTPTTNLFTPDTLNPFVVLDQTRTYILNANDGQCTGGGSITLNIDTSYGITTGPDAIVCTGTAVQLNATITGTPPSGTLNQCGANNTPCTGGVTQQTFTPGNVFSSATTPFQGNFFSALYEDERTQILYHASDLLAQGFTSGTISHIWFNISAKQSAFPFQNVTFKLGCTADTDLSDTAWLPTTAVYTNVFYGTVAGWNDITLQNTYDWDGTSNLVLEICWDNPDGFPSTGADYISAGFVSYNAFHTGTAATANGCNLPVPTFDLEQILPEFRVTMCPPPPVPVTYVWTPAAGLSATNIANPVATPTSPTTYYVTAYFGGACPKVDSVKVVPGNFNYTLSNDTFVCPGNPVQLTVTGGTSYSWTPSQDLSCSNCTNPVASPAETALYFVTITDTVSGCIVTDSVNISVQFLNAIAWFVDTLVDQGTPVTLGVDVTGGNGNYSYLWTPSDYLNNVETASPVSTPLADVLYTISVTSGPCVDTEQVHVRVNIVESPIKMPNAFTPNGDGHNDLFYPVSFSTIAKVKTFRIYNRYGEMVHDDVIGWDGNFKNKGQPSGTYVYYIVISRPFKDDEKLQGSFSLLR